jgi:hypothetical protein
MNGPKAGVQPEELVESVDQLLSKRGVLQRSGRHACLLDGE